jgi:hypothetical protein
VAGQETLGEGMINPCLGNAFTARLTNLQLKTDIIIHYLGGKPVTRSCVTAAQVAFSARIKVSSDVSENTKNAQAIAKVWRGEVHTLDPDRFQVEALVTPELDQKLDSLTLRCRVRTLSIWRNTD